MTSAKYILLSILTSLLLMSCNSSEFKNSINPTKKTSFAKSTSADPGQQEETGNNKTEVATKEKPGKTFMSYGDGEVAKDMSDRESRAISIPAGNAGDVPSRAIGIPAETTGNISWLPYFLLSLTLCALIIWLVFRKRAVPIGVFGSTEIQEPVLEDIGEGSTDLSYKEAVKDHEEEQQISRIKEFMIEEQAYLDPEFTIKAMADALNLEVRELSLILNNSFHQNFYDFLNQYRIEKAQELLKDSQNKNLTILEILYSVGFNSKSSFNTSFKKLSGLTPTQYRQKYCR